MEELQKKIKRNLEGKKIVFLFILTNLVYAFMLIITIPRVMTFSNGLKLLDMMPTGYNSEYVNTLFETLGENGRHAYLYSQIPIDMIYPFLFGISYSLILAYFLNKLNILKKPLFHLCLFPLIAGLFDYLENFGIITMLINYPNNSQSLIKITNSFTIIKSIATSVYFIGLIIILIILGIKTLNRKKIFTIIFIIILSSYSYGQKPRARDLGIPFVGETGQFNSITDVKGVEVGYSTIISGNGKNIVGKGPIRTGVTAIFPRGKAKKFSPVYANWYSLNGNGEMTGTTWVTESGFLETPIMITNTNSVGVVRDAVLKWYVDVNWYNGENWWYTYPVVAETYDGFLNDIYGFHVKEKNVLEAIENSSSGRISEGNVGGGTGMMCLGFKGGTGTSSRVIKIKDSIYTVGVIVQSNFGAKKNLTIAGVPVGIELKDTLNYEYNAPPQSRRQEGDGSIIVIVATDAPLLPHQLKRIAQRVPLGIGIVGGRGSNGSGDIFLAFSTANENAFNRDKITSVETFSNDLISPFFEATVQAVEEAIINAMVAAETMEGINGNKAYALPHDLLIETLKKYNRIKQ